MLKNRGSADEQASLRKGHSKPESNAKQYRRNPAEQQSAKGQMNLLDEIKLDEGCVLHVYLDSLGIRTAGYGRNLEACGIDWPVGTPITQAQADTWLLEDTAKASTQVDEHLPWAKELDRARHDVLVNMAFNMGIHGLLEFHRTLAMIEAGNYEGAASAMLESKWAAQVGHRASRLSQQMETGAYA